MEDAIRCGWCWIRRCSCRRSGNCFTSHRPRPRSWSTSRGRGRNERRRSRPRARSSWRFGRPGEVDLEATLRALLRRDVMHVLVEGPRVFSAFIRAGLADALVLHLAPSWWAVTGSPGSVRWDWTGWPGPARSGSSRSGGWARTWRSGPGSDPPSATRSGPAPGRFDPGWRRLTRPRWSRRRRQRSRRTRSPRGESGGGDSGCRDESGACGRSYATDVPLGCAFTGEGFCVSLRLTPTATLAHRYAWKDTHGPPPAHIGESSPMRLLIPLVLLAVACSSGKSAVRPCAGDGQQQLAPPPLPPPPPLGPDRSMQGDRLLRLGEPSEQDAAATPMVLGSRHRRRPR
jgi:hypothetical protein